MNTMADGAAPRLVAQIGEALFGQPGMTLDVIANRCIAERRRFNFEPILHSSLFDACSDELNHLRADMAQIVGCLPGVYYMDPPDGGNVSIPEQVRRMAEDAAQHRRAAQPSPAGQGDAPEIERIRTLVSSILSTVSLGHQRGPYAYAGEDFGRYLAEATRDCRTILRALSDLAAPRPVAAAVRDSLTVGISAEWVPGYLATDAPEESREAIRNAFAEYAALSAAGQPVGKEPVAFANPEDAEDVVGPARLQSIRDSNGMPGKVIAAKYTKPLYAAPPAQSVDLEQLPDGWRLSKKATCYQLSHGNDIVGNLIGPDAEENAAIIARALDRKAVGNG